SLHDALPILHGTGHPLKDGSWVLLLPKTIQPRTAGESWLCSPVSDHYNFAQSSRRFADDFLPQRLTRATPRSGLWQVEVHGLPRIQKPVAVHAAFRRPRRPLPT